jgi:hypothetical protein
LDLAALSVAPMGKIWCTSVESNHHPTVMSRSLDLRARGAYQYTLLTPVTRPAYHKPTRLA